MGLYRGLYRAITRVIKGDTWSLDNGTYKCVHETVSTAYFSGMQVLFSHVK